MTTDVPGPPLTVVEGDDTWNIDRAWPTGKVPQHSEGNPVLALEASSPASPHVRGGLWSTESGAVLASVGADPRLPALARRFCNGRGGVVISHRPGRRAVLRSPDRNTYVKVVRPGRGPDLVRSMKRSQAFSTAFATPTVLEADQDSVVLSALPGASLLRLAELGAADWDRAWREWATAWVAAVAAPLPAEHTQVHDADAEHRVLATWLSRAEPMQTLPERKTLRNALDGFGARWGQTEPGPLVPAHRDLHDQQILWDRAHGVALLDVDTFTTAEAALDLGNLRAHVRLRELQGLYTLPQGLVARAHIDSASSSLEVDPIRVDLYERASLLRLRCVYAFRPRWREAARSLPAEP